MKPRFEKDLSGRFGNIVEGAVMTRKSVVPSFLTAKESK